MDERRPRLLKVVIVQIISVFVLFFIVFLAYCAFTTRAANKRAEALCLSVPRGSNVDVAMKAIRAADTEPRLRHLSPDSPGAGFRGAFVERWYCSFTISGNKVIDHEVRLID